MLSLSAKRKLFKAAGLRYKRPPAVISGNRAHQQMARYASLYMKTKNSHYQIYLATYDITSDKVRRLVAKYLERKGFERFQRSVYLGTLSVSQFKRITKDLYAVNTRYENWDSIALIPLYHQAMERSHFIGKSLDFQYTGEDSSCIII